MKNKKNIIIIGLTIIFAIAFLLIYNYMPKSKSDVIKITYSRGGGLTTYADYLANAQIEISNNLTVTLKPASGKMIDYMFKSYKISKEDFEEIVKQINETHFMQLPDNIEDKMCMDGPDKTISVETKEKTKDVHIYCKSNYSFEKVAEAIINAVDKNKEYTNYCNEIRETHKDK